MLWAISVLPRPCGATRTTLRASCMPNYSDERQRAVEKGLSALRPFGTRTLGMAAADVEPSLRATPPRFRTVWPDGNSGIRHCSRGRLLPGLLSASLEKCAVHASALTLEHVHLGERGGVEVRRGDRALGGLAIVHEGRQGSTANVVILPSRGAIHCAAQQAEHDERVIHATPIGRPATAHGRRAVAALGPCRQRERRSLATASTTSSAAACACSPGAS